MDLLDILRFLNCRYAGVSTPALSIVLSVLFIAAAFTKTKCKYVVFTPITFPKTMAVGIVTVKRAVNISYSVRTIVKFSTHELRILFGFWH